MVTGVRAFIATSQDGFIAGPDDDLSWLPDGHAGEDYGYDAFMAQTAAIIMGRRTYDVVCGFGIDWPYGGIPVFVVTSRPLETDEPTVQPVSGTPVAILARVREVTDGGVYGDGGEVIRQFLNAGLIDEVTVTGFQWKSARAWRYLPTRPSVPASANRPQPASRRAWSSGGTPCGRRLRREGAGPPYAAMNSAS